MICIHYINSTTSNYQIGKLVNSLINITLITKMKGLASVGIVELSWHILHTMHLLNAHSFSVHFWQPHKESLNIWRVMDYAIKEVSLL